MGKGLIIAGFVCSLVGCVFSLFLTWFGLATSIVGLVLSKKGKEHITEPNGMATAGVVLGTIGVIIASVTILIAIIALLSLASCGALSL